MAVKKLDEALVKDTGRRGALVHFIWASPPDPSFPSQYEFRTLTTMDELKAMVREFRSLPEAERVIAFDIETTALNPENVYTSKIHKGLGVLDTLKMETPNFIVGVSLCFSPKCAYYVPLKHRSESAQGLTNFPEDQQDVFWAVLTRLFEQEAKRVLLFNARFDLRWCEHHKTGIQMDRIPFFDLAVPVWIADTNFSNPSLKWAARHFLGWSPATFEDTLKDNVDFSYTTIEDATSYAATDALMTYALFIKLTPVRKEFKSIIEIDNQVLLPVRLMEETFTPIDWRHLQALHTETMARLFSLQTELNDLIGEPINLNSPKQLVQVLKRLGIDTGKETDSGQMSTGADLLEAIADTHPFLKKLVEYRQRGKMLTTYIENLLASRDPRGLRFSYQTTKTPTGRLAGSGDKKNSYFCRRVNIQAITKADGATYSAEYVGPSSDPKVVLGWKFVPDPEGKYKGFAFDDNLRLAWKAYPNHWFVHIDYSTQELRIPANLSGEPTLVNAFLHKEDLHRKMAAVIWGEVQKSAQRQNAKALNFGALYGGTKYTFAKKIGCSLDEAQEYLNIWWKEMSVLDQWRIRMWSEARARGYVQTYFGRPRRVRTWYQSRSFKSHAFGDRTVVNTVVQGGAADLMKVAMIKVYRQVLRDAPKGSIYLLSQVHDELNFSISKKEPFFTDQVQRIIDLMAAPVKGWQVPMLVEASVGTSWGWTFPFHYDATDQRWVPIKD